MLHSVSVCKFISLSEKLKYVSRILKTQPCQSVEYSRLFKEVMTNCFRLPLASQATQIDRVTSQKRSCHLWTILHVFTLNI